MLIKQTEFDGLKIYEPKILQDDRGFFYEGWKSSFFDQEKIFVQDNYSYSKKNVLRGLHYQKNKEQGKFVNVIYGSVQDIVVDLRKTSSTFGKYFSINLSYENKKFLWIPTGFAHGFYVLSDFAYLSYKITNYYSPNDEVTIKWNDSDLNIVWQNKKNEDPIISLKDQSGISFKDAYYFS